MPYLELSSEGNRILAQKFSKNKTLRINFAEFQDLLNQVIIRIRIVTFERHKLLNRPYRKR